MIHQDEQTIISRWIKCIEMLTFVKKVYSGYRNGIRIVTVIDEDSLDKRDIVLKKWYNMLEKYSDIKASIHISSKTDDILDSFLLNGYTLSYEQ